VEIVDREEIMKKIALTVLSAALLAPALGGAVVWGNAFVATVVWGN
jgi:hypothetical protein